ncbi:MULTISPECIES: threonyl-tRNA synthetase editing domain-containing protein [unclassified Methanoculleus]|jgi:hypothetical protein|uniref:Threonyl-tRNA synthetase editing domain-containing protein n=1 Tax=Methanoculleus palmolei TaxID=72612 RepID=A0ABD8A7G7_9EURY|nr:threonyl-tRNA synthetase editing domain-containing protein [Methanoculleus sp. UBA377]MDD2474038.1 threonyl-tRNA synthetase editing domain-containing protein [Methanoculleus sp.]WOX55463.1 threonyl-tRNA synthetase editing domain-containing protein [Methanoculleus palmolei]
MKILMFNTEEFWYRVYRKAIESAEVENGEEVVKDALVIFVNVEQEDEGRLETVVRKAADNIAWLARKTGRTAIVLHSFAHLSESKADVEFSRDLFVRLRDRLAAKGYTVTATPFGCLNEFRIHVLGDSLAKVWKSV